MDCNFEIKIEGNLIYIKKQKDNAKREITIYNLLGNSPYTSNIEGIINCSDVRYTIVIYKLLVPYEIYFNLFENIENKELIKQYFIDTLNCYKFMISKNIIHGDLKPQNVLFTNNEFVLSDFDRSEYIIDGNLYNKISIINKDFLRFIFLFKDEFFRTNRDKITFKENYQKFYQKLQVVYNRLDKQEIALKSKFQTIDKYFEFIEIQFEYLTNAIQTLSGGKIKLKKQPKNKTYKQKNGINNTSYNTKYTKRGLSFYYKTRRKSIRNLYRK
jgi:serine/threonine protein kinase